MAPALLQHSLLQSIYSITTWMRVDGDFQCVKLCFVQVLLFFPSLSLQHPLIDLASSDFVSSQHPFRW